MVVEAAVAGTSVLSLCVKGDAFIMEEIGKIFKKEKEMKKGQHFAAFHFACCYFCFDTFLTHCWSFQELLFQLVCLLTTACAISPLWRVTLMWFWRREILSKCKLKNWCRYSVLFPGSCSCMTLLFLWPFNSDLGVHVDGFISNVAHSLIVGVTKVWHRSPVHFPALFHSFSQ